MAAPFTSSLALPALKLVQRLIKLPLFGGFVSKNKLNSLFLSGKSGRRGHTLAPGGDSSEPRLTKYSGGHGFLSGRIG
jgi:hypothetical protein